MLMGRAPGAMARAPGTAMRAGAGRALDAANSGDAGGFTLSGYSLLDIPFEFNRNYGSQAGGREARSRFF